MSDLEDNLYHLFPLSSLNGMKNESKKMLLIFESILSRYDPAADQKSYQNWDNQVYEALTDLDCCIERMINMHWVAFGTDGINEWKQITMRQRRGMTIITKLQSLIPG